MPSPRMRTILAASARRRREEPAGILVPGCRCYLAAGTPLGLNQSEGAAIAFWADASGSGNHATQATAARQPTAAASGINGVPAVNFDGAGTNGDELLIGANFAADFVDGLDTPFSIVAVVKVQSADTGALWGAIRSSAAWSLLRRNTTGGATRNERRGDNAFQNETTTFTLDQNPHVISEVFGTTTNNYQAHLDGVSQLNVTHDVDTMTLTTFYLGGFGDGADNLNMRVGEWAFFDRALSTLERQLVERDMAARYGITVA